MRKILLKGILSTLTVTLLFGCHSDGLNRKTQGAKMQDTYVFNYDGKTKQLSVQGACNNIVGLAKIEKDVLQSKLGNMASTRKMCDPAAMQKDEQLIQFISSHPHVVLKDNQYYLVTKEAATNNLNQNIEAKIMIQNMKQYNKGMKPESYVTKFVYVSHLKKECQGVVPQMCLQIRENKTDAWQNYYGVIEGFNPEPNIDYRLRLHEFTVKNPPADASSKRWVLDLVVEQSVVNIK